MFVSEYQQCFKNALQHCHELMRSIDLIPFWTENEIIKKKPNPKPFLQSQMGVIMSMFPFWDVWLLTFGRELRNRSWYGSYDSTVADSKHLIKSQVRKVIIYQYYKRICLIVRVIWGSKILALLNKKGLGLAITDST